jgi:predicted metal-dependent hydrolase
MVYLENQRYTPKDAVTLLKKARSLVSGSQIIVRDSRVAKHHIEFDISIPDNKHVNDIISSLSSIAQTSEYQHIVETNLKKDEAIRHARILFNNEKYWGAHEILEAVWKNALKDEKDLLNGLILIAAAFVHEEKDESDICISILKRAMQKLSKASGLYFDLNVNRIKDTISQIINTGEVERFAI